VPRLAFGLLAVGLIGIATAAASGFDFRFPAEIREIAAIKGQDNSGLRDACFEEQGTKFSGDCIEPGDKPLLLLWGASTAASLSSGLKQQAPKSGFRLAHFAAAACAPILAAGANTRCDQVNEDAFGHLKSFRPDVVLLHAEWEEINLALLRKTIDQLVALRVPRIVILGPVPVWKRTLPHALVNFYRFHHQIPGRIATGMSGPSNDLRMEAFSKEADVGYISAWHLFQRRWVPDARWSRTRRGAGDRHCGSLAGRLELSRRGGFQALADIWHGGATLTQMPLLQFFADHRTISNRRRVASPGMACFVDGKAIGRAARAAVTKGSRTT